MTTILKRCLQLCFLLAFAIGGAAFLATPQPASAFVCMGGGDGCYDHTCSGHHGPYQCCIIEVNTYCGE